MDLETGKLFTFSYRDVETDIDEWVDASRFLPKDYDLVLMKVKGKKTFCGWYNINHWDGLKLKPEDIVSYWKRTLYEKMAPRD